MIVWPSLRVEVTAPVAETMAARQAGALLKVWARSSLGCILLPSLMANCTVWVTQAVFAHAWAWLM